MNTRFCAPVFGAVAFAIAMLAAPVAQADGKPIRLAIVNTPAFSGLIGQLVSDFKTQTGLEVDVY